MTAFATRADRFFGLFLKELDASGAPTLVRHSEAPPTIPDPATGRALKVSTLDARARAICPSCATAGAGGFVSFVGDLRLAYACPACEQLVWLQGA